MSKQVSVLLNPDRLGLIVLSSFLMIWIAYYNGFPLVVGDSGAYLAAGLELRYEWSRPVFYGLWIFPFHMSISLWPLLIAQSIHSLLIVFLTIKSLGFELSLRFMAIVVAVLVTLSTLPWYVSQVGPDYSTALAILCSIVLGRFAHRLTKWEFLFVLLTYQLMLLFHLSNLVVCLGMVLVVGFFSYVFAGTERRTEKLLYMLGPILVAMALNMAVTYLAAGRVALSPYGYVFTAGTLVEDGTLQLYLEEHCGQEQYSLCDMQELIPDRSDDFIWSADSPLNAIGGVDRSREELQALISATLASYPLLHAEIWFFDVVRQLHWFDTGESIKDYGNTEFLHLIDRMIMEHFPGDWDAYLASVQNSNNDDIRYGFVTYYNTIVYVSLVCILLILALRWRSIADEPKLFCLLVAIGVFGNAMTTAIFSEVVHRYQNRVIWLVPLLVVLLVASAVRSRTGRSDRR
jgi:hypothetical protein